MNERIRELAKQAGMKPCADMSKFGMNEDMNPYNCQEFMLEKFAELIVGQMLDITDAHTEVFQTDRDRALIEHIKKSVKQHFGVEE